MKNLYILVLLIAHTTLIGQTIVPVEPGNGTLNMAIENYIETNGSVDDNVVFELQDGGIYILSSTIDFEFDLHISAAPEAEVRPVIQPAVATGGESFRPFRVRTNIRLNGLYITSEDALGARSDQIIRVSNDGARVIVNNCHIDKANQAAFRFDNENNKIYVTNSVISNITNLQNPSNGRGFDDRGQDIDTLWVENCTFYNLTARLLRDGGGTINWLLWNQTTSINSGDRTLDMGETREAIVTNNIFINPAFLGDDEEGSTAFQLDSIDDEEQNITISHNNFYRDPSLESTYMMFDSVFPRDFINGTAMAFIMEDGLESTIYNEAVAFAAAPATPVDYVSSFYTDPANALPLDDGNGGILPDQEQLPFDLSYTAETPVNVGGDEGQRLGDLNWFDTTTNITLVKRADFDLVAFPNPSFKSLTVAFESPTYQEVRMEISGQMGQTLLYKELSANTGSNQIRLNTSALNPGMYFLKLGMGTKYAVVPLQIQ